jgi:hypothetical protein
MKYPRRFGIAKRHSKKQKCNENHTFWYEINKAK